MKSIVDKLSSRLEKVENGGGQSGNQGESGEVKEHTHKSSDISDRISDTISDDNKTNLTTGNAVMNYVGTNTLKLTPNIYDLYERFFVNTSNFDHYIPLCLVSTPYFECKCGFINSSMGNNDLYTETQCFSVDIIYSNFSYFPCRVIGYYLRNCSITDDVNPLLKLVVVTKDSKEIVCLKISFTEGYRKEFYITNDNGHFLITNQQLIDVNLTEEDIQTAKEAKNCEYYPSILNEYNSRIAALEKKVSDLEGGA